MYKQKYLLVEAPEYSVYHGSPNTFEEFKWEYLGSGSGKGLFGPGFYFAKSEETASGYGDVSKWKIRIDRPLSTKKPPSREEIRTLVMKAPDYEMNLSDWDENLSKAMKHLTDHLMEENQYDAFMELSNTFYNGHDKLFAEMVMSLGYDGVVIKPTDFGGNPSRTFPDAIYIIYDTTKATKKKSKR